MDSHTKLIDAAKSASVSIQEYLDGTWDGSAEGWVAIIEALNTAIQGVEIIDRKD